MVEIKVTYEGQLHNSAVHVPSGNTLVTVAKRKNLDVGGMTVDVRKFMSDDAPRRIKRLELDLRIPLPASHPDRPLLENTARGCPVHHSIHPDIEVAMNWEWLAE